VREQPSSERTAQRLDVVLSEIHRIESVARDYLSFSRPATALDRTPIDLAQLVARVVSSLEGRARAEGVTVSLSGEPLEVRVDPRRLQEACFNLVANAIEACTGGAGTVEVRWVRADETVRLSVHDSGRGMSEETLSRVGTAFFTTREGGTGLGVALARSVAEQHGGTLTYESVPSRGTVATLSLPAV
jgi:signal transduction histidine kinase